ncbi:MAG: glutamate 5-kinase [Candidatus Omnitrophica bacterium]|nr:glutamate 5-kinase [Candidatus Omnitrophota bacterium]
MKKINRIVVKVGTKVLTSKDRSLDKERVKDLAWQIADIRDKGIDVLLVTSGAIGAGMWLLGMKKRPSGLSELQAAAAIGQNHLMQLYSEYFRARGYVAGQILLTQEDFNDRKRYLNIKHTIGALLKHKAIPVINENDTVATDEIRCGDNDRLSSLVADICRADGLILLTDVDGLLDEDGSVIAGVADVNHRIMKLGGKSRCDLGTGGMATKLMSAKAVAKAGIECVIANGTAKNILRRIVLDSERLGTTIHSADTKLGARKRWIAYSARAKGVIRVDDGARAALSRNDRSLLASGIVGADGRFVPGDVVGIVDRAGVEFARGISGFSVEDVRKIKGLKSADFKGILGHKGRDEVVHKDNLVIL